MNSVNVKKTLVFECGTIVLVLFKTILSKISITGFQMVHPKWIIIITVYDFKNTCAVFPKAHSYIS